MGDLIGELIVRSIPVLLPAFLVLALLTHWGIIGPSSNKGSGDKETKKATKSESSDKGKEETKSKED